MFKYHSKYGRSAEQPCKGLLLKDFQFTTPKSPTNMIWKGVCCIVRENGAMPLLYDWSIHIPLPASQRQMLVV